MLFIIVQLPLHDVSKEETKSKMRCSKMMYSSNHQSSLKKQLTGLFPRSISSPIITLKPDGIKPQIPSNSTANAKSHNQKDTKHTYHEIYIDLQNSIMLEHETDSHYGQNGLLPNMNKNYLCFEDNTCLDGEKENLEMVEEEQEEEKAKYFHIVSNSVLESYAELKSWTNNTTDLMRLENKVINTYFILSIVRASFIYGSVKQS